VVHHMEMKVHPSAGLGPGVGLVAGSDSNMVLGFLSLRGMLICNTVLQMSVLFNLLKA
jgi:hypothetical protein